MSELVPVGIDHGKNRDPMRRNIDRKINQEIFTQKFADAPFVPRLFRYERSTLRERIQRSHSFFQCSQQSGGNVGFQQLMGDVMDNLGQLSFCLAGDCTSYLSGISDLRMQTGECFGQR